MTDHARQIAEWMEESLGSRPWNNRPDLNDHADLGIIEWWCRDRGVWIGVLAWYPDSEIKRYSVRNLHTCRLLDFDTFPDALLAAVKVAKEMVWPCPKNS